MLAGKVLVRLLNALLYLSYYSVLPNKNFPLNYDFILSVRNYFYQKKSLWKVNRPMPIPPVRVVKSLLTFLSALCRRAPPYKCSIACLSYLFVTPVDQL